jgi:hypothetical protein
MTKSKIKVKEHENLSEANIKRVIELLEAEKPIPKKDAYAILNISPNPTRLAKIIENYKEEKAELERRRAQNRGKPPEAHEIQTCIEGYLDGDSISDIAQRLYRSVGFVKEIVEQVGVPSRVVGANYSNPGIIPEPCIRESFEIGEIVWHAKEHAMAIIVKELDQVKDKSAKYYRTLVIEALEDDSRFYLKQHNYAGRYVGAYSYDLGSLEHLKQYGVDVYRPYRQDFANFSLKEN